MRPGSRSLRVQTMTLKGSTSAARQALGLAFGRIMMNRCTSDAWPAPFPTDPFPIEAIPPALLC